VISISADDEIEAIKRKKMEEMLRNSQNTTKLPQSVVNINSVDQLNNLIHEYIDGIIIIDFWAEWCGPCKAFAPHFERLQQEYCRRGEKIVFTKINVDNNPQISGEFGITAIPTTVFLHNRKVVYRNMGMVPGNQFKQIIEGLKKKLNL